MEDEAAAAAAGIDPYIQENDDAVETLANVIENARFHLAAGPAAAPASLEFPEIPPHDPARYQTTDASDEPENTNGRRANFAHFALKAPHDLRCDEDFADLVTNLLHLAHQQEADPQAILTTATRNFLAEAGPLTA